MITRARGAILVQESNVRTCAFCNTNLQVVEGVAIYNKNWYHAECWNTLENQQVKSKND